MTIKPGWQGRCFEDFTVGDVYPYALGRTITDFDNIWFTLLTVNPNPIHFDQAYVERTPFKKLLVDSTFTLALVTGLSVADVSQNAINLGWEHVRLCSIFTSIPMIAAHQSVGNRLMSLRDASNATPYLTSPQESHHASKPCAATPSSRCCGAGALRCGRGSRREG